MSVVQAVIASVCSLWVLSRFEDQIGGSFLSYREMVMIYRHNPKFSKFNQLRDYVQYLTEYGQGLTHKIAVVMHFILKKV